MKRLIFCFLALPCFAADLKPTFTVEQAQLVINLANAEMKLALAAGNYPLLRQLTPIAEEILRAAQEAQRAPAAEVPK